MTNVSLEMRIHTLIEIICGIIFICRVLVKLKFKMSKGLGAKVESLNNYVLLVRLFNLVIMTTFLYQHSTQACFCKNRPYFFAHCYFKDLGYEEYHCFPYDKKEVWGFWAESDFKEMFPDEPFNLIERSLYECLSGDNDEMY